MRLRQWPGWVIALGLMSFAFVLSALTDAHFHLKSWGDRTELRAEVQANLARIDRLERIIQARDATMKSWQERRHRERAAQVKGP